jgi:branched-chain amino acid transport system permease protein
MLIPLFIFFPRVLSQGTAFSIMVYGLAALAFNILCGYTGYLSFGHGFFFGLGCYITGLTLKYLKMGWLSIPISLTITSIISLPISIVTMKRKGPYFALTTLALGETLYFLLIQFKDITGGDDGLIGIPRPPLGDLEIDSTQFYYLSTVIFILSVAFIRLMLESGFGKTLLAIRDNEERVSFLGYNVSQIKMLAMAVSALFTALAGSLQTIYLRYAAPTMVSWMLSGEIVFMSILGGTSLFFGPLLGAFIYTILRDFISLYTPNWPLVVGILFVILILKGRRGILEVLWEYFTVKR